MEREIFMKFKKVLAAVVSAAVLCLTVSSCGKSAPEPEIASKEHVYREEKIELPHDMNNISSVFYNDGKIYIIGSRSESSGNGVDTYEWTEETAIQIIGLDGKIENTVVIAKESGDSYNYSPRQVMKACGDSDGGIVTIDSKPTAFTSAGVTSEYNLVRYSETGKKLSDVSLNGLTDELEKDNLYVYDMISLDDRTYLIMLENTIAAIDRDGKLLYEIKDSSLPENTRFYSFARTADGRLFTSYDSYEFEEDEYVKKIYLVEVDVVNKKLGERRQVASPDFIDGSDKYDLYVFRESGLAGYDIETGETETIIDWLKSGFDTTIMNSSMNKDMVYVLPDGRILCQNYEYESTFGSVSWNHNDMYLSLLTEIPPEELPDKKSVKLYALSIDNDTRMRILEFNKNNLEYEIELTSYADYTDGADRMNTAMVSGNIPDVILMGTQFDNTVPVENYISKGLFADIYKFIDDDPVLNRTDFLENVLKSYEVGDRLYQVVPIFQIETIACKTSLAGETRGWTIEEFMDFVDAHPDCKPFNDFTNKNDVLDLFIKNCYESYIDMDTGKCSFDGDEFIRVLEFSNRFPNEISEDDDSYKNYNYFTDDLPNIRSGKRLFYMTSITKCSDIRWIEKGTFDDNVTFKGYPSKSGSGSSIRGEKSFAIMAKAANPEGAWQFVRYFLTEDYQDMCVNYGYLPLRESSLKKQAEACKERPYDINPSNGEKIYRDNTFFNGFTEVNIGVNTDEDNKKIIDFIKSADRVYHNDRYITVIVEEEAGAYFAGQKSAEDVAEIIQNRVQNYLDENR